MSRPLLIAIQFLTRFPIRLQGEISATEIGRSLLYYPLIGLLLGGILAAAAWALTDVPTMLGAALVLTLWAGLTGALHLDGLADTIDAWAGGRGDPERTLALLKDPCSGPQGVTGLVLVLLIKFAALVAILESGGYLPLLLAPFLGRSALPLLFLTTPYVRQGGLGTALAAGIPRSLSKGMLLAVTLATILVGSYAGVLALASALITFLLLRRSMMERIGGATGDLAGALVEFTETTILTMMIVARGLAD